MVAPIFDEEFKLWIKNKGYTIDNSMFEIKLNPPQNFAQYRQTEMDQQRVGTFTQIAELPYMSKRFALKRFLGMTEEEMAQNSQLWAEENNVAQKKQTKSTQMRTAGVSQAGIQADLDQFAEPEASPDSPQPESQSGTPGATGPTGNTGTPGTTPGGGGTT
jgi:hypothetical protein